MANYIYKGFSDSNILSVVSRIDKIPEVFYLGDEYQDSLTKELENNLPNFRQYKLIPEKQQMIKSIHLSDVGKVIYNCDPNKFEEMNNECREKGIMYDYHSITVFEYLRHKCTPLNSFDELCCCREKFEELIYNNVVFILNNSSIFVSKDIFVNYKVISPWKDSYIHNVCVYCRNYINIFDEEPHKKLFVILEEVELDKQLNRLSNKNGIPKISLQLENWLNNG